MQYRGQVVLRRLPNRAHLQRIGQLVALHTEAPTERGHIFGSRRHTDLRRGHLEFNRCAVSDVAAHLDFNDAARVREYEFDLTESWDAKIAGLGVQRGPVGGGLGLLPVDQKWFAHMRKHDFFEVLERLDGRIFTGPSALPGTEQRRQRAKVRMQLGPHTDSLNRRVLRDVDVGRPDVLRTNAPTDDDRRDELQRAAPDDLGDADR